MSARPLSGDSTLLTPGYLPVINPSGDKTGVADAATINNATAALGTTGGRVVLGAGTFYVNTPLLVRAKVHLEGQGRESTVVMLANGANTDVFQGVSFATLTGSGISSNIGSGPSSWSLSRLTVDGNRAAQTTGGYGVRVYGFGFDLIDMVIRNAFLDGLWTEWGSLATAAANEGPEARLRGVKIHDCGRWGWHNRGPDDSIATDCVIFLNNQSGGTAGAVWHEDDTATGKYGAAGPVMTGCHLWGDTHAWALIVDTAAYLVNCEVEGARTGQILVRGGLSMTGGKVFQLKPYTFPTIGIQLGDDGATVGAPTTFSYTTSGCNIDTLLQNFWGAARTSAPLNWVAANHNRVRLQADLAAATASSAVAAGSVGAAVSATTLTVASTTAFPTAGRVTVPSSGGGATLAYSGVTATTFTGVTVVSGTGTVSAGNAALVVIPIWGTPDTDTSRLQLHASAPSASQLQTSGWSTEKRLGSVTFDVGKSGTGFALSTNYNDMVNLNASGAAAGNQLQHVNGLLDRWYSGAYANPTVEIDGATGHVNFPSTLAPTVSNSTNSGTGGFVTVAGNDTRGTITLTTGTGTPVAGTMADIAVRVAFASTPIAMISPTNAASAALRPYIGAYSTTTSAFGVGVAPAASTTYYFTYVIYG